MTTENIWHNFHNELLSFIKKQVKDGEIANDLLQEIFIKIHLKLATLSDADKLTSWVYQITRNSILDYFKKRQHFVDISVDIDEQEYPTTFNDHFGNCLKPFINELPETYREAILQTDLGQLSQKEFAEKMGISYSGAKSRVQRGRQQLLTLFRQCCFISTDKYGNILDYQNKKCVPCR